MYYAVCTQYKYTTSANIHYTVRYVANKDDHLTRISRERRKHGGLVSRSSCICLQLTDTPETARWCHLYFGLAAQHIRVRSRHDKSLFLLRRRQQLQQQSWRCRWWCWRLPRSSASPGPPLSREFSVHDPSRTLSLTVTLMDSGG